MWWWASPVAGAATEACWTTSQDRAVTSSSTPIPVVSKHTLRLLMQLSPWRRPDWLGFDVPGTFPWLKLPLLGQKNDMDTLQLQQLPHFFGQGEGRSLPTQRNLTDA